jgi:hypothetical protein
MQLVEKFATMCRDNETAELHHSTLSLKSMPGKQRRDSAVRVSKTAAKT